MRLTNGWLATIVIVAVILLDQILKIWVKTNFYYGEELYITDWFRLFFIENNGMAFGFEFGNKLILTWFRIIAVCFLIYYIVKITSSGRKVNRGYLICVSLITSGDAGNMIDCIAYGLIFDNPPYPYVATLFPPGGGYETIFNGRVVDMLYFPLVEWNWPEWMPLVGGEHFIFFQPVFNIADAALSVGMIVLILFFSKHLMMVDKIEKNEDVVDSKEINEVKK